MADKSGKLGKLIVIEGLDGSGKATQAQLAYEKIKGFGTPVRKLTFPDYKEPSSALVKMYLNGDFGDKPSDVNPYTASAFYAVDRAASYLKYWKEDYLKGCVFVADRYATSNEIYQLSKLKAEEKDEYLFWLEDFEYKKLELPAPDAVIYLDVLPQVSQKLLSGRYCGDESKKDIHEKDMEFLLQCRESAMYSAKKLGWRIVNCCDGENIRDVESINADVMSLIKEYI